MKAVEEKNKEKKERYINSIMKIAFPLILSNAISQVQMIIDRMFLGQKMKKVKMKKKSLG